MHCHTCNPAAAVGKQQCSSSFRAFAPPAHGARSAWPLRASLQQTADARTAEPSTSGSDTADIYLGFDKYDTDRDGKKGRVIKDDPKKYPGKDDLGFFLGATGGWAGGEAALQQMLEDEKEVIMSATESRRVGRKSSSMPKLPPKNSGKDLIYIGFSKDELEIRKSGERGRFIVDDPRLYPAKEDVGGLKGATGGFVAGEVGVQQFVQQGEVRLRDPRDPRRQFSPVAVAGILVGGGVGGTLLLTKIFDVGEAVVNSEISTAPVDDDTKGLLLAAVALLGAAGLVAGGSSMLSGMQAKLRQSTQKLLVTGAFWAAVFLAARAVLEL